MPLICRLPLILRLMPRHALMPCRFFRLFDAAADVDVYALRLLLPCRAAVVVADKRRLIMLLAAPC